MEIEFINTVTGQVIQDSDDRLFVMNNRVFADNGNSYESHVHVVTLEDFIQEMPRISWRTKNP